MAQTDTSTVVGVFDSYSAAENASRQLVESGIPRENINVQSESRTTTAGGQAYGDEAAYGGAATTTHESGFMGWLHSIFGSDDAEDARAERGNYTEAVKRGKAVVSVTTTRDLTDNATRILNAAGAVDIDDHASSWREGQAEYALENNGAERRDFATDDRKTIPVVEEEMQIGKRAVRRGGVRVYSRVVDEPVNEQINLREERVKVERRPVDREISGDEIRNLRDQTIEVMETSEEAVIGKRARVKEEVIIGKEMTERTENVRDNVRRTEVKVDRINDSGAPARDERGTARSGYDAAADTTLGYNSVDANTSLNDTGYDAGAYEYGSKLAGQDQYRNRNWSDVEDQLRSDYSRSNPGSEWEKVKASVRRGWDEVTGRR